MFIQFCDKMLKMTKHSSQYGSKSSPDSSLQSPASLLLDHMELLIKLDRSNPVLDLACGSGRNGLALAAHGIPVVFADKSADLLLGIEQNLAKNDFQGRIWQVDLEQPGGNPFAGQHFSAIIVFRYLHRPLFPALKNAVMPGGLVIYETFTVENRRFGRPNNPDFLLKHNELKEEFQGWEIITHFEGRLENPDRVCAQIVTRKALSILQSG